MRPPIPILPPILLRRINYARANLGQQPLAERPDDSVIAEMAETLGVLRPGEVAFVWDAETTFHRALEEVFADRADLHREALDMAMVVGAFGSPGSAEEYAAIIASIIEREQGGRS